ncbi:hypothetical protein P4O66_022271 [Electrophorus voltai]|uniref:Uncharacterized protein n=1 Tax=Electrophorus voltai TaxID=2609070 RepID=A0AAD8ZMM2_9TELE|nr:hypothetical protein P4O66_022271 [Electrophorus voltai]
MDLPFHKALILGAIAATSAFIVTILIVLVCVGCQRVGFWPRRSSFHTSDFTVVWSEKVALLGAYMLPAWQVVSGLSMVVVFPPGGSLLHALRRTRQSLRAPSRCVMTTAAAHASQMEPGNLIGRPRLGGSLRCFSVSLGSLQVFQSLAGERASETKEVERERERERERDGRRRRERGKERESDREEAQSSSSSPVPPPGPRVRIVSERDVGALAKNGVRVGKTSRENVKEEKQKQAWPGGRQEPKGGRARAHGEWAGVSARGPGPGGARGHDVCSLKASCVFQNVLRQCKLNSMSKSDTRLHEMQRMSCNANGAPRNRPASMDLLLLHSCRSSSDLRLTPSVRQLSCHPTNPEGKEQEHTYSEVGLLSSATPRCLDEGLYESVGMRGPPPDPGSPPPAPSPTVTAGDVPARSRTCGPESDGTGWEGGDGGGAVTRGGVNEVSPVGAEYASIRKGRRWRREEGSEEAEREAHSVSGADSPACTTPRKTLESFHLPNFPKEAVFMGNGEQYIWKPPEENNIVMSGGPTLENGHSSAERVLGAHTSVWALTSLDPCQPVLIRARGLGQSRTPLGVNWDYARRLTELLVSRCRAPMDVNGCPGLSLVCRGCLLTQEVNGMRGCMTGSEMRTAWVLHPHPPTPMSVLFPSHGSADPFVLTASTPDYEESGVGWGVVGRPGGVIEISEMYSTVCKTLKKKPKLQQQGLTQQANEQAGSTPALRGEETSGGSQAWPPGGALGEEAQDGKCTQEEHCYETLGEKSRPQAELEPAYATLDAHRKREKLASDTLNPKKNNPGQTLGPALTCENFYESIGDMRQGASATSTTTIFTFNDGMEMYVTGL